MTSEEALDQVEEMSSYVITSEYYKPLIKKIREDLEVLEILKKHLKKDTDYCGTSEFATHTAISLYWDNEESPVDSKEGKEHKLVKEWLEHE